METSHPDLKAFRRSSRAGEPLDIPPPPLPWPHQPARPEPMRDPGPALRVVLAAAVLISIGTVAGLVVVAVRALKEMPLAH